MSPPVTGILGVGLMLVLMAFGMPIGLAMALAGFLGTVYVMGWEVGLSTIGIVPYATASSYLLTTVPLFILMGQLAFVSGISSDLFEAAYRWIGKLRGGLAIATIGSCAVFSAACGSSSATAAAMGTIALPEMNKHGYRRDFSTGTVAVGGTLGILIPPSIPLIIYGVITEESIGKLFIAGVIPGIILAFLYAIVAIGWVSFNPRIAPPAKVSFTWKQRLTSLLKIWGFGVLIFLVLGGIWLGWFTTTEAASIGAAGAFLITFAKGRLSRSNLLASLKETGAITCMVFTIVIGAMIFSYFLAVTRLPMTLAELLVGASVDRYVILAAILMLLAILGCFMDATSMILLTTPILFPVVTGMGFDPIWFGIIMTIAVEAAVITPPVGMNVFVIAGIAKDVPVDQIFRGVIPYLVALAICLVIMIAFPQTALYLPGLITR